VVLRSGRVGLRPLSQRDAAAWREIRGRNQEWLTPWEATVPPGDTSAPATFRAMVRQLRRQARQGRSLPFAVTVEEDFAGQLTVSHVVGGSARWAQIGYWIDKRHAGQGVMPTAVALAVDHCFFAMGLHRVEIAIRPENTASLRVVQKLGLTEYGYARGYLHIDGAWRDHRLFSLNLEEVPEGLLRRYRIHGPVIAYQEDSTIADQADSTERGE
jgi:ribosomal-protein-alanine N-acetyltransferase